MKNYAESVSAALDITNEDETVISATLCNKTGYELGESDRHMRMLISLSNHFSIEKEEDIIVLVLAFECLDMR